MDKPQSTELLFELSHPDRRAHRLPPSDVPASFNVLPPSAYADAPPPAGYERRELFYPLSSRAFRRSPLRLPLKAVEHPLGMGRLARLSTDVVHLQWLAWPRLDRTVLRLRAPAVFTAHDLLPRRTAGKRELWHRLF